MTATANATVHTANAAVVLSKAVARAAERLNVSRSQLAKVLGVSPSTVTRLYAGDYQLEQHRKEWEFALLFVRLFRSLDSIVGEESTARSPCGMRTGRTDHVGTHNVKYTDKRHFA